MHIVTFKNARRLLKQQLKANVVPFLHGIPGIGKSSLIREIVSDFSKEEGEPWGYADFRAALYDQVDISGYPTPDLVERVMRFLPPALLPSGKIRKGIFFVDELTKGERGTQNALFQLILDKICNEYKLPPGWKIIVAGNLGDEDQTMINDIDAPLANRMSHFLLKPDHKEWIEYMGNTKLVSQFIDNSYQFFARKQSEDGQSSSIKYAFPTPRSWDMLQRVIDANGGEGVLSIADLSAHATSLVGSEASTALISFLSLRVKISGEDIVENLSRVKSKLVNALKEGKNGYATMEAAVINLKTYLKDTDPGDFINPVSSDSAAKTKDKENRRNNLLEFIYDIVANDKFGKREMAKGIFEDFFSMTSKDKNGKEIPRTDLSSLMKTRTAEYRKIIASRPEAAIKPDSK
jgi:hypothetical protein